MTEATETKKGYELRLKSNETIFILLTEEAHQRLESAIHDRAKMFLQIGERTLARTEVRDFYPVREEEGERLAKHLRLTHAPPQDPASIEAGMRKLFEKYKSIGQFNAYRDYDEFKHAKHHQESREGCVYCEKPVQAKAEVKNTVDGEPVEDVSFDQIPF